MKNKDLSIARKVLNASLHSDYPRELSRREKRLLSTWEMQRRPSQTPPTDSHWNVWIHSGGPVSGKTRTGAEETVAFAESHPKSLILLVGPSHAYIRDTMIEGASGILGAYDRRNRAEFAPTLKPSIRRLEWPNGACAFSVTDTDPDSVRGLNAEFAWADGAYMYETQGGTIPVLDQVRYAVRRGEQPRIIVTTEARETPATEVLDAWLTRDPIRVRLSESSTHSNLYNMHPSVIKSAKRFRKGSDLRGTWPWPL